MKIFVPEKSVFTDLLDNTLKFLSKSEPLANLILAFMLFSLKYLIRITAAINSEFNERLKEKNFTAHKDRAAWQRHALF